MREKGKQLCLKLEEKYALRVHDEKIFLYLLVLNSSIKMCLKKSFLMSWKEINIQSR